MTTDQLNELEGFYNQVQLPTDPIRLDDATLIDSPQKFVEGHLEFVKANMMKPRLASPYYDRLFKLKIIIENGKY